MYSNSLHRSQSSTAHLGRRGMGAWHHGCAAESDMDQNLWGMVLAPCCESMSPRIKAAHWDRGLMTKMTVKTNQLTRLSLGKCMKIAKNPQLLIKLELLRIFEMDNRNSIGIINTNRAMPKSISVYKNRKKS